MDDIKVIAMVGRGRSGTTILDNLLGEIDGFFSGGELHELFRRLEMGFTCGCGKSVRDCDLWSSVVATTLKDPVLGSIAPSQVVEWQDEVVRLRHLRKLFRTTVRGNLVWPALETYMRVLGRLYQSIGQLTGARVVVDS